MTVTGPAICPAARLAVTGDQVIVLSYGMLSDEEARSATPTIVHVDDQNRVVGGP